MYSKESLEQLFNEGPLKKSKQEPIGAQTTFESHSLDKTFLSKPDFRSDGRMYPLGEGPNRFNVDYLKDFFQREGILKSHPYYAFAATINEILEQKINVINYSWFSSVFDDVEKKFMLQQLINQRNALNMTPSQAQKEEETLMKQKTDLGSSLAKVKSVNSYTKKFEDDYKRIKGELMELVRMNILYEIISARFEPREQQLWFSLSWIFEKKTPQEIELETLQDFLNSQSNSITVLRQQLSTIDLTTIPRFINFQRPTGIKSEEKAPTGGEARDLNSVEVSAFEFFSLIKNIFSSLKRDAILLEDPDVEGITKFQLKKTKDSLFEFSEMMKKLFSRDFHNDISFSTYQLSFEVKKSGTPEPILSLLMTIREWSGKKVLEFEEKYRNISDLIDKVNKRKLNLLEGVFDPKTLLFPEQPYIQTHEVAFSALNTGVISLDPIRGSMEIVYRDIKRRKDRFPNLSKKEMDFFITDDSVMTVFARLVASEYRIHDINFGNSYHHRGSKVKTFIDKEGLYRTLEDIDASIQ